MLQALPSQGPYPFPRRACRAITSRVALGREGERKQSLLWLLGLFLNPRLWPTTSPDLQSHKLLMCTSVRHSRAQ